MIHTGHELVITAWNSRAKTSMARPYNPDVAVDRKLKVVHIITMLEMGGAQGNTLFTVANLDRSRFEVGLITGPGGILDDEARKIADLDLKFVSTLVRPVQPFKDLAALVEITKILKKAKPDIVHTHSSKAGIIGRLAARIAGVPKVIHSIHGFGFNPYQKFLVRWLYIYLEKLMAGCSDVLIAVAEENIKAGVRLRIGSRQLYRLIRSGVDIQKIKKAASSTDVNALRQELRLSPETRVVLSVGPFKPQKDPIAFVECAAKVVNHVPHVKFLWSGDGELRREVEDRVRELQLENVVQLLGWRKDIPALLRLCDVFILTSLWEGLPRAGVEALIVGKPVVAFDVDGVSEIVRNETNGFVLSPGSDEEFARKLIQLLSDQNLHDRFSEGAVRTIDSSFDIHDMVRQQEELYTQVVG
jgi:glycosyltransferase involved in cell wall biosynthesis